MTRTYDDSALWHRVRGGDTDAFGLLFDRHANAVYRLCFIRTADWALAEDLTSAVFLEAWRKRERWRLETPSARPWLLGVATNITRNHLRAMRRYRHLLAALPRLEVERDFAEDLAERLDAREAARRIDDELRLLPKRERDVLLLRAAGLSSAQIGEALGISQGIARARLFRARRRLQGASLGPTEIAQGRSAL